jgi:hypothetical protein
LNNRPLNNINFESDLSTIQFRSTFKGHISTEYCCLVMNLASVSTISYADSNDGIFLLVGSLGCIKPEILGLTQSLSRPDCTSAFSRRNANYFACFFWIATTRINYFYLIAHNSKETGEIFRISPIKSARGIRPSRRISSPRTKLLAARCECLHLIKINCLALWLDESAHAWLAARCEELRARTGNPPSVSD